MLRTCAFFYLFSHSQLVCIISLLIRWIRWYLGCSKVVIRLENFHVCVCVRESVLLSHASTKNFISSFLMFVYLFFFFVIHQNWKHCFLLWWWCDIQLFSKIQYIYSYLFFKCHIILLYMYVIFPLQIKHKFYFLNILTCWTLFNLQWVD